jgi:hypothetical protein
VEGFLPASTPANGLYKLETCDEAVSTAYVSISLGVNVISTLCKTTNAVDYNTAQYDWRFATFTIKRPRPLEQCCVRSVEVCASTSVAAAASRTFELLAWNRKHTPTLVITPHFYPSMSCIVHTQHRNKRAGVWRGNRSAAMTLQCRTIACSGNGDDTILYYTGTTLL